MKSPIMRVVFTALVLTLSTLSLQQAQAQDFASRMMPPALQKTQIMFVDSIQPDTTIGNGSDRTSLHRGAFVASVPFAKTDKKSWTASTAMNWIDFSPDQKLVPNLYQLEAGITYTEVAEGNRFWAANINFGSASDQPFKNPSTNTFSGNYFYVNPTSAQETWIFLVNYSNNRPFLNNIPLPGFAYVYAPSKTFRGTFGAPFANMNWEFSEGWTWNFFTLIPWVVKTSIDYRVAGPAKVYTGIDFSQSTYYLHDRIEKNDRLFYDEKKIFIGGKSPISKAVFADVEAGYAFDRRFFSAENYEINPANSVGLGSSAYVKVMLAISVD